jgi:hypothetical protein
MPIFPTTSHASFCLYLSSPPFCHIYLSTPFLVPFEIFSPEMALTDIDIAGERSNNHLLGHLLSTGGICEYIYPVKKMVFFQHMLIKVSYRANKVTIQFIYKYTFGYGYPYFLPKKSKLSFFRKSFCCAKLLFQSTNSTIQSHILVFELYAVTITSD